MTSTSFVVRAGLPAARPGAVGGDPEVRRAATALVVAPRAAWWGVEPQRVESASLPAAMSPLVAGPATAKPSGCSRGPEKCRAPPAARHVLFSPYQEFSPVRRELGVLVRPGRGVGLGLEPGHQLDHLARDLLGRQADLGEHLGAAAVVEEARCDAEVASGYVDVGVAQRLADAGLDAA